MKVCKICLKKLDHSFENSLWNYLYPRLSVCSECLKGFHPKFKKFHIGSIQGLAIYEYDSWIAKLLHQYKDQGDLELANVFLESFSLELHFRYHQYVLVPMPSSKEKQDIRGFNHIYEMFKVLKLPFLEILEKRQDFKQSLVGRKERWKNRLAIQSQNKNIPIGLNILLVDDVMTTGATLYRAIELISKYKPKNLQVLVMSKNERKRR